MVVVRNDVSFEELSSCRGFEPQKHKCVLQEACYFVKVVVHRLAAYCHSRGLESLSAPFGISASSKNEAYVTVLGGFRSHCYAAVV